eukprot:4089913-Amphidinium_carterae.2
MLHGMSKPGMNTCKSVELAESFGPLDRTTYHLGSTVMTPERLHLLSWNQLNKVATKTCKVLGFAR